MSVTIGWTLLSGSALAETSEPMTTSPASAEDQSATTVPDQGQVQSRDVIRDHRTGTPPPSTGGVPPVTGTIPSPSGGVPPSGSTITILKPDLVGRKVSCQGGMGLLEVKNQGTGPAGAFFTQVKSFNKQTRVRTGALPPNGVFTHQVPVGCPPQGPCVVSVVVDVNREVSEVKEGNNVFSFQCP